MKKADMNWAFVSIVIVIMLVIIMATIIYKQKSAASSVIDQGKGFAKVTSPVISGGTRTIGRPAVVIEGGSSQATRQASASYALADLLYDCYLKYEAKDENHKCGPVTTPPNFDSFLATTLGDLMERHPKGVSAKEAFLDDTSQSCTPGFIKPNTKYYACIDDEIGEPDLFLTTNAATSCDC